jgi:hypothetical protein
VKEERKRKRIGELALCKTNMQGNEKKGGCPEPY